MGQRPSRACRQNGQKPPGPGPKDEHKLGKRIRMDKQELIALQLKGLDWWYEGFGSGDIDHAYQGFADDVTWSGLGKQAERTTYTGKQAVINYQKAWVHNVWAGSITYIPKHTLCDGNVLMAEWEDEAIVAATGEKYTNRGIF